MRLKIIKSALEKSTLTESEIEHVMQRLRCDLSVRSDLREQVRVLREAVEQVLTASEDGGGMNDIDWQGLRKAWEQSKHVAVGR